MIKPGRSPGSFGNSELDQNLPFSDPAFERGMRRALSVPNHLQYDDLLGLTSELQDQSSSIRNARDGENMDSSNRMQPRALHDHSSRDESVDSNGQIYYSSDLEKGLVEDQHSSSRTIFTRKQHDDEDGELEDFTIKAQIEGYTNFAYLTLGLSYALLYCIRLKTLGRKTDDDINGMMVLHVWSIAILLLFFISWFLRCPFAVMKLVRFVISVLLFTSSFILVVLLDLTL